MNLDPAYENITGTIYPYITVVNFRQIFANITFRNCFFHSYLVLRVVEINILSNAIFINFYAHIHYNSKIHFQKY